MGTTAMFVSLNKGFNRISAAARRRVVSTIFAIAVICFVSFYFRLSVSSPLLPPEKRNIHRNVHNSRFRQQNVTKSILLWSGTGRVEAFIFGKGKDPFVNHNCLYTRCEIVHDRSERPIESYDAVVVVLNDEFLSPSQLMMPQFPANKRNASQRVVFFTQEAPPALRPLFNMSQLVDIFNWTMTYRFDSDIPFIYGRVIPVGRNSPLDPEQVNFYRERARSVIMKSKKHNKTKSLAWMVSHCDTQSQRETYAKALAKHIDVDIYGKCGNMSCASHSLHTSAPHCYTMLESTYKFYLSFENSLCPDYVTEKFFKIMGHDIVPIVYGGADYSRHAPPHSYIDARHFKPKELAAYLKQLDADDALYNEYFWWKDHYRVEYSVDDRSRHAFCDLCQMLHESDDDQVQTYPQMESFWGNQTCLSFDPNWI
jgi:alpha-1,3-fucosyltransferase